MARKHVLLYLSQKEQLERKLVERLRHRKKLKNGLLRWKLNVMMVLTSLGHQ